MSELIKTLDEIWKFYENNKQGIINFFTKRASIEQIKRMLISEEWLPTPENINVLPEPVRKFIHEIEMNCDPAGIVRENILIKDTCKALVIKLEEKKKKITKDWIEEKARGLWISLNNANVNYIKIIKDFIRSLVEEIQGK